eukprot:gene12142-5633_t
MGNSESGFGSWSTSEEVARDINLTDKVIIVTGSTSGIGIETARVLCKMGAHVIISYRSEQKYKDVIKFLEHDLENPKYTGIPLDLADFSSIEKFIEEFKKLDLDLHTLILNAGVMSGPERLETKDGFEETIGINHYGHFKLTMGLLPLMKNTTEKDDTQEGRIVVLSSAGYFQGSGKIDFDDIHLKEEGKYGYFYSYCQSKLANLLFSMELSKKLKESNIPITVNALHPGIVKTDIFRNTDALSSAGIDLLGVFLWKSIEQGAATTIYVATAPELKGKTGFYFNDCEIEETQKEQKKKQK